MARKPAYYYQAGNHYIGTFFSESLIGNWPEFADFLFVFDSTGRRLRYGFPDSGSPVLRTGLTATASATWSYAMVGDAYDGNPSSRWTTGEAVTPGVTYFQLDTHASQFIGTIRVNDSQFASDIPMVGDVFISADGLSFTRVARWNYDNIRDGILTVTWPPVVGRYIKLVAMYGPQVAGNWFSIGELTVFATIPPTPGPAWILSSSASSGGPVANAIDDNTSTRWATGGPVTPGTTFFQLDMRSVRTTSQLRIDNTQYLGDIPAAGDIYTSTDGTSFTRATQWTSANIASGILTVSWTPRSARIVKLVATATPSTSTNWFSIGEITVP